MLGLVHSFLHQSPYPQPFTLTIGHLGPSRRKSYPDKWGEKCRQNITYISHWSLKKWLWRSDRKPVVHAWAYLLHREPRMSGHACAESASCSDGLVAWRGNGLWNREVLPMLDPTSTCLESVVPFATKKDKQDVRNETIELHKWLHIIDSTFYVIH